MEEPMAKMKMMIIVGLIFALVGIILQVTAVVQEFGTFAPLQESYWSVSKADRDAALSGSELSNQLTEIQKFPPRLMTFKLVGIGSILVGICITLVAILMALKMMPVKLGKILKGGPAKKTARKR